MPQRSTVTQERVTNPPKTVATHYRPGRLLRWLPLAALLCILAFTLIALAAAIFEGVSWGWWTTLILLGLTTYFAFNFWQMNYKADLDKDKLQIHRLGRDTLISYTDIVSARLTRNALIIATATETARLYGEPNSLAQLHAVLETRAPALINRKQRRRSRPLPIVHHREVLPVLMSVTLLFGVSAILGATLVWAWTNSRLIFDPQGMLLTTVFALSSALTLLVAVVILHRFIRRVEFDHTTISIYHLWKKQRFSVATLADIRLKPSERTVRGIPRNFYTLEFLFEPPMPPLEIGPSFSDTLGIHQERARQQLSDLRHALLRHYAPHLL